MLGLAAAPIDEDFARSRPAPGRWSIVEIVAHLYHEDENVNQIRVTRMSEDMPISNANQEAECLRKKFIERKLSTELSLLPINRKFEGDGAVPRVETNDNAKGQRRNFHIRHGRTSRFRWPVRGLLQNAADSGR